MSESVFYGAVVNGKKPAAIVPRPQSPNEADECLHISQVCIPATSALPLNTRVSLVLKVGDGEPICIATLKVGHTDCVTVSILVDQYAELSVTGHKGAEVHVSGYYAPSGEPGEDDEDEDDDEEGGEEMDDGELNGMSLRDRVDRIEDYLAALQDEGDDDDDDDDMEDDDDEDDDEDDLPGETRTKHTHIKELKQDDDDDEDGQAADDDDDEEGQEGEDDDEDEDDEDDDDDGVGMAELMEKIAAENARAKAAKKRKAEEPNGADAGKKVKAEVKTEAEDKKPETKKGDEKKKAAGDKGGEDKGKVEKKVFANGFEVHSVKSGAPDAKQAKPGKRVVVKYRGTLQSNGKVFDETKGNKTFSFRLGVGEVIKGWDKGVAGMRVGDKRKLVVPPSLAYGATGVKDLIPPNSTLLFDVELVDVR